MAIIEIEWDKDNILKIGNEVLYFDKSSDEKKDWRRKIEPWLTAVFQSEHLSLLLGSGFTKAITEAAGIKAPAMGKIEFITYKSQIDDWSVQTSQMMDRGEPNFEDYLRTALELLQGLYILEVKENVSDLRNEIEKHFITLIKNIIETEKKFLEANHSEAKVLLKSFLMSFGSRTASRDRLHIFTTNYDRFIEFGCDAAVLHVIDRFFGKIRPTFRASKIDLDYHYNPPGIRGEPRYVEGVIRLTKLHGSVDWHFVDDQVIKVPLPFGASENHPEVPNIPANDNNSTIFENFVSPLVIYPNSSKGIETVFYPYSELFRDFAAAVCRPNSVLITYGYGFGDSHINKIIEDMLTIPSAHLVVMSYDKANGRIESFLKDFNNAQFTLLMGDHFGDLKTLINNYLPKAAIDRITERMHLIREKRGDKEDLRSNNKGASDE